MFQPSFALRISYASGYNQKTFSIGLTVGCLSQTMRHYQTRKIFRADRLALSVVFAAALFIFEYFSFPNYYRSFFFSENFLSGFYQVPLKSFALGLASFLLTIIFSATPGRSRLPVPTASGSSIATASSTTWPPPTSWTPAPAATRSSSAPSCSRSAPGKASTRTAAATSSTPTTTATRRR